MQGLADDFSDVNVIHIAIPFINLEQFQNHGPPPKSAPGIIPTLRDCHPTSRILVIIHSTTPPGTVTATAAALQAADSALAARCDIVHVPVRGKHPNLTAGLHDFTNYIGGVTPAASAAAKAHLSQLGIPLHVFASAETTEVAKILSTTYFGVCVAWSQEMKELCEAYGVDYAEAAVAWNESINAGYVADGRSYFQRPVLKQLSMPIGGHCVGPNARLLRQVKPDSLGVQLVLKYSEDKAHVTAGRSEADMLAAGIGVASAPAPVKPATGAASAIADSASIHASAVVDKGAVVGAGTKVWHFTHVMGSAVLGKECVLGQNVFIGGGVHVGDRVKMQNNVSVYTGVTLEDDVFLGPSCVLTNDLFPRANPPDGEWTVSPTVLRVGASVGANATIVCGNVVGRYSMVGAGAVVTRDVPDHALMVGNPAKQIGWVSRGGCKLDLPVTTEVLLHATCPRTGAVYALTPEGVLVQQATTAQASA